jgi:thiol-disulfide isomerase/thioredoxin
VRRSAGLWLGMGLALGVSAPRAEPGSPAEGVAAPAVKATEVLQSAGGSKVGQALPWFAAWGRDGRVFNRTRMLAPRTPAPRAHALTFFATWCKPCEAGVAMVTAQADRLALAGLEVVWVAVGEDTAVVEPWLAARPAVPGSVLLDRFGVVGRDLAGIGAAEEGARSALPRTVVVDQGGMVRAVFGAEGPDFVDRLIEAVPPSAPPEEIKAPLPGRESPAKVGGGPRRRRP